MALSSEVYDETPLRLTESIWDLLEAGATAHESNAAVTCCHQPADHLQELGRRGSLQEDHLSWSYAQLKDAVEVLGLALLEKGVRRGTTLCTFLTNGVESILMQWVSALLQLTYVPLDPGLLQPGREDMLMFFVSCLADIGTVVVSDANGATRLDTVWKSESSVPARLAASQSAPPGWVPLHQIATQAGTQKKERLAQDPDVEKGGLRIAAIFFTSGTSTGQPKGCPLSVRNVVAALRADWAFTHQTPSWLVTFQNFRIVFLGTLYACGKDGREFIMPGLNFRAPDILDAVEKLSAQKKQLSMLSIANQIRAFAADPSLARRDLSAMRRVLLGSDLVEREMLELAEKVFSAARAGPIYGLTESGGNVGTGEATSVDDVLPTHRGIVSSGRPLPGTNLRIVDEDEGKAVVPLGAVGSLHLGGPTVIAQYLGGVQPELTYSDDCGNWIVTGDLAMMDEGRNVFIMGRTKDIVKRNGRSLAPSIIEAVLHAQTGVDARVFGYPDPIEHEVPVAVINDVVDDRKIDEEDLKQVVKQNLGPEYALKSVHVLSALGLDTWPLNATGKVQKLALKERVLEAQKTQ